MVAIVTGVDPVLESKNVIDDLVKLVSARVDRSPDLATDFARAYLRRVPGEYLDTHDPDELAAHVAGTFTFVESGADDVAVRVWKPVSIVYSIESERTRVDLVE